MNRIIRSGLPVILFLVLSGCARTTTVTGPDSEALTIAHSVPIELAELDNRPLQEQVSFLGRYLLGDSFRVAVAENAAVSEWGRRAYVDLVEYRSIGDSTVGGMAVSQAVTGDLFSNQGSNAAFWSSVGIDIINSVLATLQMSDVSGFFMPSRFGDVEVQSAEQATQLAIEFTESRIRDAVNLAGYDIACHLQCDSDSKIFRLTLAEARPGRFAPKQLYLYFGHMSFIEMPQTSEDHLLAPLLGFIPKYISPTGNSWTIVLGTKLDQNKKSGVQHVDGHSRLVTTPLSREIRRAIYSNQRFMFWGSSVAEVRSSAFYVKEKQPGLIYFDGAIYAFPDAIGKIIGKSDTVSVTHVVD